MASDQQLLPKDVNSPKASILTIPAEIRNRIYRLALYKPGYILVNKNYKLPALLQTTRKIRTEAKSIYFLEHNFRVDVTRFRMVNYAALLHTLGADPFYEKMCNGENLTLTTFSEDVEWTALLAWCKAFYEGRMPQCRVVREDRRGCAEKVASRAFRVVDKLRHKMSWDEVKDILWQYKFMAEDSAASWWGFAD